MKTRQKLMGRIEHRTKNAFEDYQRTKNITQLCLEIADIADKSVNSQGNRDLLDGCIKHYAVQL